MHKPKYQRQHQFKLYNRTRIKIVKFSLQKSMSMKSWDFVDPKLGKKISELEKEINELKKQRIQISQNDRITIAGKQKLLKYNEQCMKDILLIYNKNKELMVEYFDRQVTVLTKQEINDTGRSVKQNRGDHNYVVSNKNIEIGHDGQKNSKNNEVTKISFSEDCSYNQNHSLSSSKYNKTKCDISKSEQIQQSSNQFEKTTKIQHLNTTGRFTSVSISRSIQRARSRSKSRGPIKEIRSFQKTNTARNYTYHENQNSNIALHDLKKQMGPNIKRTATVSHAVRKRLKRKLANKSHNLQMQKILNILKSQKVERLEKEIQESNQLIDLLRLKITILQKQSQLKTNEQSIEIGECQEDMKKKRKKNNKQKCIKQQRAEREIANQLHKVREKYIQIQELENKNQQLSLKRKQILKLIEQSTLNSKCNQILI